MHIENDTPFPIDAWSTDMRLAVDEISAAGSQMLQAHRKASPKATSVADKWRRAERLEEERQALTDLFERIRCIFEAIEQTRELMHLEGATETSRLNAMNHCADVINANLQGIEDAYLVVRHSALDLLRWVRRSGHIEESDLPELYRACYARLIAYAPKIKPRLDTMQQELLHLRDQAGLHPEVQRQISALARYRALADSARGFFKSVIAPPLDLVFHDTQIFNADWELLSVENRGDLATEFNDCCQFLLYDVAEFYRRVLSVRPDLADDMEASLFVLPVDAMRVIFTVDEGQKGPIRIT